ncbi:MAG: alpha-2-macroglobulin family protein [Pseudomonadota bacterium]
MSAQLEEKSMYSRRLIAAALYCLALTPGLSQTAPPPVPERRLAITENVDFYGSDLSTIFETTLETCSATCLTDSACQAFTFNARAGACFLKTQVSDRQPYSGALSAIVIDTAPSVLARSGDRAAELGFLDGRDLTAARDAALALSERYPVGAGDVAEFLQSAAEARAADNPVQAVRMAGVAVVLEDAPDLWAALADDLLAAAEVSSVRNRPERAFWASVNGYLRADGAASRAALLETMARALEKQGRGRDSLAALRLASTLSPREDIAAALERATGLFGFRVTDHEVESDTARPQVCATFSDLLVEGGVDYATFLQTDAPGLTVDPVGNRLCIGGVAHGTRYQLTLRAGLPALTGEVTAKPVTLNVYVRDRAPSVRFPGRAYVLPKSGDPAVPVTTVNAATLDLALYRVDDRNFVRAFQSGLLERRFTYWQRESRTDGVSQEVWRGTGDVQNILNQDVSTRLPMSDLVADLAPGLYMLQARVAGTDGQSGTVAVQSFVISDLGLATMTGSDGLHVFVRSLETAAARPGLEVSLLSEANTVLATTQTDADGYARFADGLMRGTGGAAPNLLMVEDGGTDIAILSLTEAEFDLSDRGVEGRAPAQPIDVFLTTERGAYRAGETIHATVLARDGLTQAINGLPLTALLRRPDGVEYARHLSSAPKAGGHVFEMPLAASVPRGTWTLNIHADPEAPALASRTVLVEDFVPERIDFKLALPAGALSVTDTPPLTIDARYLFGAPGADLPVEGMVRLSAVRELPAHPGFLFGRHDAPFAADTAFFGGTRTDAQGQAEVMLEFPQIDAPGRPLQASVSVTLSEGSGRPVERRIDRLLTSDSPMIGVRPRFEEVAAGGQAAAFDLITVDPSGETAAMPVRWSLNRLEVDYQWYRSGGNWSWEPITTRRPVTTGEALVTSESPARIDVPVEWGYYELRVEPDDGGFAVSSVDFYAGWYAPADASQTPDTLDLSLDQPSYAVGDTATVTLRPRFAGTALVSVVSNRLIDMQMLDLDEGQTDIRLPVTGDWGTGAYVTATVIRPMNVEAGRNPTRALGLVHAAVDPGARRLEAAFEVPAEVQPRAPLDVALRVSGVAEGETAWATIAAVDVGILNLTSFDSPDPEGHYFGQRKLGMALRDVYGRLINGLNGDMGLVRSGGDALLEKRFDSPPPTEELVSYFSGPVSVDSDGVARASFDLPSFNGSVRLMAVVWSDSGVGQAEAEVLVRDPVVVSATVPRFLAPGDTSRLLLDIVHATGPTGEMPLQVSAQGVTLTGAVPGSIALGDLGKAVVEVPLRADTVGTHSISVQVTTPEGRILTKDLTLAVQRTDPEVSRQSRIALGPGDTFAFDASVFAGLHTGTASATLSSGPLARFDAPGLLMALDRYPYGCTEQITSAAMPLLYFEEVASALGLNAGNRAQDRIEQAVTAVLANQAPNGAFGLWRPDTGDLWLDAFVSDFLSRARAQGIAVPDIAFRSAMDNLRNRVNYYPDFESGGADLAYALYVLAREGAAAIGDLRYYADARGDAFDSPLAAAQLGGALAAYGEVRRADAMFARATTLLDANTRNARLWASDYGTTLRDAAAVLAVASEAGTERVDRDAVAARITRGAHQRSTQEAVWSLLAAHALIEERESTVSVDGVASDGPIVQLLEGQTADERSVAIRNTGDADVALTLTTFGVPSEPEPAQGNGWRITRNYYDLEGNSRDPSDVEIGMRLVAVLEVTPLGGREARLMINDPLPAGFEIDNPNLIRAGDVRALDWLGATAEPRHTEFRADRFLAAVDHFGDRPFRLAYIVRAVSPGVFHHPAASVEDMYRPPFRARTDAGQVTVTR